MSTSTHLSTSHHLNAAPRLVVDPIACDGIGMCAHVAPDVVELDPWGFPVLRDGLSVTLDGRVESRQGRRAVRACPRRALRLLDAPQSSS
jgi:ferredoxin